MKALLCVVPQALVELIPPYFISYFSFERIGFYISYNFTCSSLAFFFDGHQSSYVFPQPEVILTPLFLFLVRLFASAFLAWPLGAWTLEGFGLGYGFTRLSQFISAHSSLFSTVFFLCIFT